MKTTLCILVLIFLSATCFSESMRREQTSDIYLVIYTTKKGYTGHVGFAVDNYRIVVRDTVIGGKVTALYDTVRDHTLTYFDLWGPSEIAVGDHDKNLQPRYYTLPRSSSEKRITVDYFLTEGLPHSYDYPCDALIRIKTTALTDQRLREIAAKIQQEKNYFNSRSYNCTDYAIICLNQLFGADLEAKEYIPFQYSSTPNQFYLQVTKRFPVEIIKSPGDEVNNSFFRERVINSVIYNQLIHHEKTN
jgi:hypothetical protein